MSNIHRLLAEILLRWISGTIDREATAKVLNWALHGPRPCAVAEEEAELTLKYRGFEGLRFCGPLEWALAVDLMGRNPLGLTKGWCPCPEVPFSDEQIAAMVELCKKDWDTVPVLWLALPEVGGMPANLAYMRSWWGLPHHPFPGGIVSKTLGISSALVADDAVMYQSPITKPTWRIGYEDPKWARKKTWYRQLEEAEKRGVSVADPVSEAMMLVLASTTGPALRQRCWARVGPSTEVRTFNEEAWITTDRDSSERYSHVGLAATGFPIQIG